MTPTPSPRRHQARPRLETLEDRCLPSTMTFATPIGNGADVVTLQLNDTGSKLELLLNGAVVDFQVLQNLDGVLVTGAAGEDDLLELNYGPGLFNVPVQFDGGSAGQDAVQISADGDFVLSGSYLFASVGSSVDLTDVETLILSGGASGNTLDAASFTGAVRFDGGEGDDTLTGSAGSDILYGGLGNDTIYSLNGGNDDINGGLGDDAYFLDPGSIPTVTDVGGNDTIDLSQFNSLRGFLGVSGFFSDVSGQITDLDDPSSAVEVVGTIELILGTPYNDTLVAINVRSPDLVQSFKGGLGDDTLRDESSALSTLFDGGEGNDYFAIFDDSGTLSLTDLLGVDTIDLSGIEDGGADVSLRDTSGTITTEDGSIDILGAIDNILGTKNTDTIDGNSLPNILDGGEGSDTLDGGAGDDVYRIKPGSTETIIDSGGIDTLDFSAALRGISLSLGANGPQVIDAAGNRILLIGTIENVIGTMFDDDINGNSADNVLVGLAGNDVLRGQSGRDILIGGDGADRLNGGSDEDIVIGDYTIYDQDVTALTALQAEWSARDRSYRVRIDRLKNTNAAFYLVRNVTLGTVLGDGDTDVLTGAQQADWFFTSGLDNVTDKNKGEDIN